MNKETIANILEVAMENELLADLPLLLAALAGSDEVGEGETEEAREAVLEALADLESE